MIYFLSGAQKSKQTTSTPEGQNTSSAESTVDNSAKLVYLTSGENKKEIYSIDQSGSNKQLLLSDEQTAEKIKSVSIINSEAPNLIVTMGAPASDTGNVYLVSVDGGAKKEKILKDFSSFEPPVASPDGKELAYISFDNSEQNYGYSIETVNIDGTGAKKLLTSQSMISHLTYCNCPADKKIGFIQSESGPKSKINYVYEQTAEERVVAEFDNAKILSLDWNPSSNFVFIKADAQNKIAGEIFTIASDGTNLKQLTQDGKYKNYAHWSPHASLINYWLSDSSEQSPSFNQTGKIMTLDNTGARANSVTEANYLIGWMP